MIRMPLEYCIFKLQRSHVKRCIHFGGSNSLTHQAHQRYYFFIFFFLQNFCLTSWIQWKITNQFHNDSMRYIRYSVHSNGSIHLMSQTIFKRWFRVYVVVCRLHTIFKPKWFAFVCWQCKHIHAKRGYFVVQRKRENHWINILQWKYIETVLVYVSLEESIWFYLCLLLAQRVSFFSLSVQFRPLFYFTEYTYGFQYFTW